MPRFALPHDELPHDKLKGVDKTLLTDSCKPAYDAIRVNERMRRMAHEALDDLLGAAIKARQFGRFGVTLQFEQGVIKELQQISEATFR